MNHVTYEDLLEFIRATRKRKDELIKEQSAYAAENPVLSKETVIDEEKSVRWNREEVVRRNNSHKGTLAAYTAKISKLLINAKPEELDEAKDELKKLHDNHVDICKNYRDEKETQLEEAYQKYLQAESEKESAEQEKQAARGQDAGKQMSMDAWATEEE